MGQGPETKRERDRIDQFTFEEYEHRYVLAIKTNDAAGAEVILGAVFALLWNLVKGYGMTRQAKHNEKMLEWEEFNTAVNEALARARTLRTHISYLRKDDVMLLLRSTGGSSLTPITARLASRITTITIPPGRKARK